MTALAAFGVLNAVLCTWTAATRRSVPSTWKLPREWRSMRERWACNAWHMFLGSVPMPGHRLPTFAAAAW
jgi:hypothetical protein